MKISTVLEDLRMVIAGALLGTAVFNLVAALGANKLIPFDLALIGGALGATASGLLIRKSHVRGQT